MSLYLVRHGQDQDNADHILNGHRDQPLTELGVAQAHTLADMVAASAIRFSAIYSSPLQRALHTARIIANRLSAKDPIVLPDLIERDFGVMTGVPQSDIVRRCAPDIIQGEKITYFLSPPGAETFPDLVRRADRVLQRLASLPTENDILIVTHGDFGKMLYAAYYRLDWKRVLLMFHFGNSEMLKLSPDSPPGEAHVFRVEQHNL